MSELPPPLPPPAPSAAAPGVRTWRWIVTAAAVVLAGIAVFLVVRDGDDPEAASTPAITTAPDGRLAAVLAEVQAARAEVERLTIRADELRAMVVEGPDPSLLQQRRDEIAEIEAAVEAAEARAALPDGWVPLAVTQVLTATLPGNYEVRWGDTVVCEGLADCTALGSHVTSFYIDVDPDTGELRAVVPGVALVPLTFFTNEVSGFGLAFDSGLPCNGSSAPGSFGLVLGPGLIAPGGDGVAQVQTLVGWLLLNTDPTSGCPPAGGERSLTAVRVP